jgi:hypothetical protein
MKNIGSLLPVYLSPNSKIRVLRTVLKFVITA